VTAGQLGHSRKLHLRMFLGLLRETRPVSDLKTEGTLLFGVSERTTEQAVSDLESAGYLSRARACEGDQRRMLVSLTALGQCAVDDPSVAEALIELPKQQREHREGLRDPLNPDRVEARLEQWRRAMRG
jgi:hypothetical protein